MVSPHGFVPLEETTDTKNPAFFSKRTSIRTRHMPVPRSLVCTVFLENVGWASVFIISSSRYTSTLLALKPHTSTEYMWFIKSVTVMHSRPSLTTVRLLFITFEWGLSEVKWRCCRLKYQKSEIWDLKGEMSSYICWHPWLAYLKCEAVWRTNK